MGNYNIVNTSPHTVCDAGKNTCSELELDPRLNLKFYVNAK